MASLDFGSMEPEKILKILSETGYQGVGWTLSHIDPRKKSLTDIKKIVELTSRFGMEISEAVVQQDVVSLNENLRKSKIDLVLKCIEVFSDSGINTINLFTGPAPWDKTAPRIPEDISEGKAWDMVFDAYDRFVSLAEKKKVNLAVEGVFGMLCRNYYTTRVLIDEFNCDWLGVNFDPSHDVLSGNIDVGWIIKQWGKKIKHVHLKDAAGVQEMGKFIFPLLGEGYVDWKLFFSALDNIGYNGFMSVEFESFSYYRNVLKNNPKKAAEISLKLVKKLFEIQ